MLHALSIFILIMCLHPIVDRKLSTMYNKYENVVLDEFDNCDYMHKIADVGSTDLVVMQLNIRGIGLKRSQLIDLIDSSVQNKNPDVLLLSETWLTPFSPIITVPGYELHRQDRSLKKVGGVAVLVSKELCCCVRPDLASKLEESE